MICGLPVSPQSKDIVFNTETLMYLVSVNLMICMLFIPVFFALSGPGTLVIFIFQHTGPFDGHGKNSPKVFPLLSSHQYKNSLPMSYLLF